MKTLQEILDAPIVGNAHHDRDLMNDIHDFIVGPSMADKVAVLQKLDRVMGLGGTVNEADVISYIRDMSDPYVSPDDVVLDVEMALRYQKDRADDDRAA